MNRLTWAIGIIIVLAIGAWYFNAKTAEAPVQEMQQTVETDTLGTYTYECDSQVRFAMTPASDMKTLVIAPIPGANYPAVVTLAQEPADSGVRFGGGGYIFTARGETVVLTEGGKTHTCTPTPSQDMAPFNFGD